MVSVLFQLKFERVIAQLHEKSSDNTELYLRVLGKRFTALFKNTRTLKSQRTFAFFAAVSHLSGAPRKQNFT